MSLLPEAWTSSLIRHSGEGRGGISDPLAVVHQVFRFLNKTKWTGTSHSLWLYVLQLGNGARSNLLGSLANISQRVLHIANSDKLLLFN